MGWAQVILALCALQRLVELVIARRNEQRLRALGAVEHGAAHYKLIVVLHAAWFAALAVVLRPDTAVSWPLIVAFALLQAGRIWVLATLGRFWTTDRQRARRGLAARPLPLPPHPNYAIVAADRGIAARLGQRTIAAVHGAQRGGPVWASAPRMALAQRRGPRHPRNQFAAAHLARVADQSRIPLPPTMAIRTTASETRDAIARGQAGDLGDQLLEDGLRRRHQVPAMTTNAPCPPITLSR